MDRSNPITKEVTVPLSPELAFTLFTSEIDTWWPLGSHSVSGDKSSSVVFEGRRGGRIYELTAEGVEHTWGIVVSWEPPQRLSFTWHPGRQADTAQRVDLVFEPVAEGTRLRLTHTGWEALGESGNETRDGYDTGWDYVLSTCYGGAAER